MELGNDMDWAVHVRAYPGAPRGGDAGIVIPAGDDGALAVLIDAAGHGLAAYVVAQKARETVYAHPDAEPDELLQRLDERLRGTTGAAVSIGRLRGRELSFAGVGNVQASVSLRPLLVRVGIVGVRMRQPKVVRVALEEKAWFIMHTDGVSSPDALSGGSAKTVAAALVEKFGSMSDDAAVLALRWRGSAI